MPLDAMPLQQLKLGHLFPGRIVVAFDVCLVTFAVLCGFCSAGMARRSFLLFADFRLFSTLICLLFFSARLREVQ